MILRNTSLRWGAVSQLLHWLIVALIALQATLGLRGLLLPIGVEKLAVLARHKSVGLTILGLATLRLLWRWLNPTPPLPPDLKPHERWLARGTHAALYGLLFALPLTGWILSCARGFSVSWFGLFQLPDLAPKSEPLYQAMIRTHAVLAACLAVIVALHVAAALKHHFLLKDDTLRRMLPCGRIAPGAWTAAPIGALAAALATLAAAPAARAADAPAAAPAAGASYGLLAAQSSLTYTFTQAGARARGRFRSFAVTFDPAAGRLDVVIDVRSLDTGDAQRDGVLGGSDFLDVARFPQARFTATRIEKTAAGYRAIGTLTLRGVSRPVAVPFTWRIATPHGSPVGYLAGETTLRRLDFGVGQGQWRDTQWVGNEVTVGYALVLTPSAKK
jgi:cytochrome b561/polyisoprenoid-binding protein YceI